MPDILIYRLAFGGFALDPRSEEGRDFIAGFAPEYVTGGACMTGFADDAGGYEGRELDAALDSMSAAGVTYECAH